MTIRKLLGATLIIAPIVAVYGYLSAVNDYKMAAIGLFLLVICAAAVSFGYDLYKN